MREAEAGGWSIAFLSPRHRVTASLTLILHKVRPLEGFLCAFLGGVLLAASPVRACDVPVFRYALERWSPDPYEVTVFHRGVLSPEDQAVVDRLLHAPSNEGIPANVVVRLVDVDASMDEATGKLWDAHVSELPWMVVRCPKAAPSEESVWAGRLRSVAREALLDSPVRREIARRILDGGCAVWILLESGHRERDDAAAELLSAQLRRMEEVLELPVPSGGATEAVEDETGYPDLRIEFSTVRVSRTDPREQMLVHMLLHSEWDLGVSFEPMAFPVFGRGRVLYALVGDGINEDNIRQACSFLLGACSCQVKDLCPGTDLLMSVDWEGLLAGQVLLSEAVPSIVGLSEFAGIMEGTGRDVAAAKAARPGGPFSMFARNLLILFAVGLVALIVASFVLKVRK